jgi:hypothetical protein
MTARDFADWLRQRRHDRVPDAASAMEEPLTAA